MVNVSPTRVQIRYSNPDEYGSECPVIAHLPCYALGAQDTQVVLDILRVTGGRDEYDLDAATQSFGQLIDCEPLFRKGWDGEWQTEYEIVVERNPTLAIRSKWKDSCTQVWHSGDKEFKDYREAQAHAISLASI